MGVEVGEGRVGAPCNETYVNAPELLHRIKSHHLLQEIIPIITLPNVSPHPSYYLVVLPAHLATGRLRKPQSPLMHKRMLDIEIVFVVKHSDLLITRLCSSAAWLGSISRSHIGVHVLFLWRDWDGIERDL